MYLRLYHRPKHTSNSTTMTMPSMRHLFGALFILLAISSASALPADSAIGHIIKDMLQLRDVEFIRSIEVARVAGNQLALTLAQLLTHQVIGVANDVAIQLKAQKAVRRFAYTIWRTVTGVHRTADAVLAAGEQRLENFLAKSPLLRPIVWWLRREHENLWRAQDKIASIVGKSLTRLEISLDELVNRALRFERRGDAALIVTAVAEIRRTIRAQFEKTKADTLAVLHGENVVKCTNWNSGLETDCTPTW